MHEDIHDEVVERLKKAYSQVRIGDPLEGKSIKEPCIETINQVHYILIMHMAS